MYNDEKVEESQIKIEIKIKEYKTKISKVLIPSRGAKIQIDTCEKYERKSKLLNWEDLDPSDARHARPARPARPASEFN